MLWSPFAVVDAFYSSFNVRCWSYRSFATRIYDFIPELWYSYFARWHCFMTCFSPFWPSLVSHLHHLHQLFYLHHLFYLYLMFFFPFSCGSSFGLEASLYQLGLLIDWMNAVIYIILNKLQTSFVHPLKSNCQTFDLVYPSMLVPCLLNSVLSFPASIWSVRLRFWLVKQWKISHVCIAGSSL